MSAADLPEAFGPYRVVEKLGEGGMGVVYLAVSPDFRLVAVKVLRPWLVGGEGRPRFAREVAVMRRVRGTRVAEVLDADVDADPAYVVTRYVRGPALPAMVADHGPLRGDALTRLATGLVEALTTVHAAGLVHRDVKPGNVLIAGRDPVLIDFGLARAVDETRLTMTGMVAGTPGYLAPETILGAEPTPATDVHGWAATVAFAGTGRPPFGSGPDSVVLDRIRRGEHDTEGLPEPVSGLVLAALHDDPAKRPTVAELHRELTGEDADVAVSAPGYPPIPPAGRPSPAAGAPMAPPPPPRPAAPTTGAGATDIPTEAMSAADIAAASGATAATVSDDATEMFDAVPPDRPDDADTAENPAVAAATASSDEAPTVADVPRVSSQTGPADATVVINRPDPPTVVQPVTPAAARPQPPEQPSRQSSRQTAAPAGRPAPARSPQQHPYAGDGAPLRSWPSRLVVATAALSLAALAGLLPWVGAAVLVAAMVVGRMVWRIRRRMYERVVARGARKHDRLVVGLATPMDLAIVIGPALGQAAVALGAGVLVGLALNPLSGVVGERTPILLGAVTAIAVAWWGPWAGRFRHGVRVLVAPTERHAKAGWIIAAVFFVTAWVLGLLWEVYGTGWWPAEAPPNPLGL